MLERDLEHKLYGLLEELAAIEHERWAHWQKYMHSRSIRHSDGSITLPAELVAQWEKQIITPYSQLSQKEQDSDKEQVMKYLPVIAKSLKRQDP